MTRRKRRGWWLKELGLGRLFGHKRVTRYKGRTYAVAPRAAYHGNKRRRR